MDDNQKTEQEIVMQLCQQEYGFTPEVSKRQRSTRYTLPDKAGAVSVAFHVQQLLPDREITLYGDQLYIK